MAPTLFERDEVCNIRLHVLPTDRFKTYAISVYIGRTLDERTVTPTALVPFVLRRGTREYPETKQFRERLDELYGAGFGFDLYKRGDYQMVQFRLDVVDERYVSGGQQLLRDAFSLLGGVLTDPALEDGAFRSKYVSAEKETLRKRQDAIVNDKIRYAAERCIEIMCADEPYRLHPLVLRDALDALDSRSVYETYREWMAAAPIDVYVVGRTTLAEVRGLADEYFRLNRPGRAGYERRASPRPVERVRTHVERLDVNQGKLNMGLRTYVTYADDDYPALLMYNGILGGYPHSKLFVNVREKASLAYYASSRLDGHKEILTIQSGIEIANYDKAVDIIGRQLDAMRRGEYSELELTQTRAMIAGQIRESQNSPFELIAFDFDAILSGRERTAKQLIADIERVTPERIRNVAERVKLDTIYFLRDREGEGA